MLVVARALLRRPPWTGCGGVSYTFLGGVLYDTYPDVSCMYPEGYTYPNKIHSRDMHPPIHPLTTDRYIIRGLRALYPLYTTYTRHGAPGMPGRCAVVLVGAW